MFEQENHLYDKSEIAKYAADKSALAQLVIGCLKSDAWKLFLGLVRQKEIEVLRRSDYTNLKDFKSDRAGLKFLRDTINDFASYKDHAQDAVAMLNDLNKGESQTPLDLSAELTAREEA